jgi:uncharacterized protein (TIGR02588 family)
MAAARKAPAKPRAKPAPKPVVSAETPLLEWIAAGVGLVLAAGTLIMIGLEGVRGAPSPPVVAVEVTAIHKTPTGYLAQIRAHNGGGSPAAGVAIEGVLAVPGAEPETAEANIDFLPARSDRDGGLYFTTDPRAGALTVRAKGYTKP